MRTPVPLRVNGLYGLKAEQVLPERISLSDHGLQFAGLVTQLLSVAVDVDTLFPG